jgi:hypothetical protein
MAGEELVIVVGPVDSSQRVVFLGINQDSIREHTNLEP